MKNHANHLDVKMRPLASSLHFGRYVALATLLSLSGCGGWLPEMVPFGAVSSPDHNRSTNGLGLHRKMWEAAGAKCLTPQNLSPKLETMDVIVLVGQSHEPPGLAARHWLEDWLARQPGRTVIYFGRDFSAEVYMRERTLPRLPAEEQPRAEQLLAMRQASELSQRLHEVPKSTFCGWFYLDSKLTQRAYTAFQGPWADGLDELEGYWPVQVTPLPPDSDDWPKTPPKVAKVTPANTPVQPASEVDADDTVMYRSRWRADEYDTQENFKTALRQAPQSQTRLAGSDGRPLIFQLTSRRFRDSQIIVVANGAPFLNGALVDPLHQQIGEQVIRACLPAERVALLAFDDSGLLISQAAEKDARGAGLEMLTVWPLSGITMPAALLGIVVCAALLPILGRPQAPMQRSVSDFGLHVEAIGRMLHEARDLNYAKKVIEEYFRTVRGEPAPAWLDALDTPVDNAWIGCQTSPQAPAPTSASQLQSPTAGDPAPTPESERGSTPNASPDQPSSQT